MTAKGSARAQTGVCVHTTGTFRSQTSQELTGHQESWELSRDFSTTASYITYGFLSNEELSYLGYRGSAVGNHWRTVSPQLLWYSCLAPRHIYKRANILTLAHQVSGVSFISSKQATVTRMTYAAVGSWCTYAWVAWLAWNAYFHAQPGILHFNKGEFYTD